VVPLALAIGCYLVGDVQYVVENVEPIADLALVDAQGWNREQMIPLDKTVHAAFPQRRA
jgi:hypothetical protein